MNLAQRDVLGWKAAFGAVCLLATSVGAEAQHYRVASYVSDLPGQGQRLDVNLVNPWGLARSEAGPWFVANNGTATATSYDINGVVRPLVIDIPGAPGGKAVPTAVVYNGTSDFEIAPGKPARYIFVSEDGTISGWNPDVHSTQAVVKSTIPRAVYKGAAIARLRGANYLYVANFRTHRIELFNSQFKLVRLRYVPFADDTIPPTYSPFNIWNIGNLLFVTYAQVNPATLEVVPGPGRGYVNVYGVAGFLQKRLARGKWFDAPWGVALAPNDFGAFTHYLLVGQFGSGQVAAFDLVGRFAGLLSKPDDTALTIPGLRALSFGNSGLLGTLATRLFFTAGVEDETHGQFGIITALPGEAPLGNGQ